MDKMQGKYLRDVRLIGHCKEVLSQKFDPLRFCVGESKWERRLTNEKMETKL